MKQQTVPTSPQSEDRQKHLAAKELRKTTSPHIIFGVVVTTLLMGSLAGFLGFVIASNIPETWPVLGKLNVVSWLAQERQDLLLSVKNPGRSVVQQAPQVINQIVTVYNGEPTLDNDVSRIGNAAVLTSDGWLTMPTGVLEVSLGAVGEDEAVVEPLVFVLSDGQVVTDIDERIDDTFSGMSYIKIAADTLSPVVFTSDQLLTVGQTVSVIEKDIGSYAVYRHQVAGELNRQLGLRSTDKLEQVMVLDTGAESRTVGSPVFTTSGEFAGVMLADGVVLDSSLIEGALSSLISTQSIGRSNLNISYTNIARLTEVEKQRHNLPESGIYIAEVSGETESDLQAGDVILSINSAFIKENDDLGVVMHSQAIGSTIYFLVLRDSVEKSVELKLTGV
ncbi:MAG: hypothetical protein COW24_02665 [Candidatus Kerfeldbacteria bacterium CG15_BIG_FIL_POST_REV_8_21_14_020_45_12]|uniref:PDZ domain-containing protein n=1 Tax=Candidatus Kerfeldbacteria bacterium CG15_BIG_FIL_POST_REV_8_21_14_020_45_12 TaxID=2014247 RepID=A0A2M7H405_9BACT|nr:MAG: hypothetical protein COW24_02665 [Candidatus Kerfeldbacteria bacterium CG15_BIG_FIL_POST_REV_8_21_14_020_45_12]